jgi:hypothetical protein
VIDVENGPDIDALPFMGLVKFEVSSEGQISGIDVEAENGPIVRYYLVFPWKWTLVIVMAVVAYFFVAVRRQRKSSGDDESITLEPDSLRTKIAQLWEKPTVGSGH